MKDLFEEFIKGGAHNCPNCDEGVLDAYDIDFGGLEIYVYFICNKCPAKFEGIYEFTSISED